MFRCCQEPIIEKVLTKPSQVFHLLVSHLNINSANITWRAPLEAKLLTSYVVSVKTESISYSNDQVLQPSCNEESLESFDIDNLEAGIEYIVSVRAECSFGSLKSLSDPVNMFILTPAEAATCLKLVTRETCSLTLSWDHSVTRPSDKNPSYHLQVTLDHEVNTLLS